MNSRHVKVSKFLSLVLRHKPETVGMALDPAGWASVDELLRASAAHGFPISSGELTSVVAENDKQRVALSEAGAFIGVRAWVQKPPVQSGVVMLRRRKIRESDCSIRAGSATRQPYHRACRRRWLPCESAGASHGKCSRRY